MRDAVVGGALGGAIGAAIGSEIDGEQGAILGSALGAATGTALATDDKQAHSRVKPIARAYQRPPKLRSSPYHCPPGQAKKGKC